MFSATHQSVTVPVGRDRKSGPHQEPIRLQDTLPCPKRENSRVYNTGRNIFTKRKEPPPLPPTILIPNFTFYFHIVRAWKVYRKYKLSKLHCNSLPNKNCTL